MASINVMWPLTALLIVLPIIAQAGDLEEQVQQIMDLAERRPVIRLNADKFRRFVGSQSVPRNYSFIVMMTALSPQRSCHICRQAHEEFVVAANSYKYSQHFQSKRLFFGSVDYDEGSEIFNSLGINSAPGFLYFNEKGNFRKPDELNIQRLGFGADVIARWIAEKTGMTIKIVRPSYTVPVVMLTLGLLFFAVVYLARNSLTIIFNRNVWAISAVTIVLLMTSGQMWNHIRGAPLMQRGRNSNNYIHGSSSGQFIVETYIVMAINAGIAIGMVIMTEALKGGDKQEGTVKRKVVARVGLFLMVIMFSLLLSVFRQKSYGYPYRLLF